MAYDEQCFWLAGYFLVDYRNMKKKHQEALAQVIQNAVEDYIQQDSGLEPHTHTCQQCDSVVVEDCECGERHKNMWCSANCKAAFDL